MLTFFVDIEHPSRHARFARATRDELNAARALIRIADHEAGLSQLYRAGTRVVTAMLRQSHLVYLKLWFEHGADSFVGKMTELGEDWWGRYRMNLKIHRFPALSRVLTEAIKKKLPVDRRAVRSRADPAKMFYRVVDVMRIFGAARPTVLFWAEKGILPAGSLAPRKNRIPASAFAVLKKMYDSSCTAEQAGALLGCTKATVRQLARIGAIHNAGFARLQDRLVVESLQALNAQFLANAKNGIPGDCVSFEQIANAIRTREEWTAFCTLAQSGAVYSKLPQSARLADLWFPRAELVAGARWGRRFAKVKQCDTS